MAESKRGDEFTVGVERFEDMSPRGKLRLFRQTDGDVILTVVADKDARRPTGTVEFCTYPGGGQSGKTLMALINLIEAIKQDNEESPQYRD